MASSHEKSGGDASPDLETVDDTNGVQCPSHTTERRLLSKIDMRVIPFLCIMYLLAFLDRINISNANIYGLSKDLGLVSDSDPDNMKFNTAVVIFFVPYCLFEIPSNILLKKFKPHVWLALNMFFFGFTTICQGLVHNYAALLVCRFFLGVFETGMFPGAFYLIGMWYKRSEAQRRYSFFFNSTTLAGAFGGLLAAAIGKMDGLRGYAGWRWIFILEGALTVFVSFFFYFLLPDFPEDVKWLDKEEREYVQARLRKDVGRAASDRSITLRDIGKALSDPKVIAGGFAYFGLIVPAYGYAYFAPGIIKDFNYSPIQTQLRSVPPWAAAFAFSMTLAYFSDKIRHRFAFIMGSIAVGISGFAILTAVHNERHVQYGALFLVTMGTYTALPIIVCWFNMNLGGHHRRAIGSAWQVGFGNLGGIIAAFSFLNRDRPKYIPGYSVCLAFSCISILGCCIYGFLCYQANRSRNSAEAQQRSESLTEEEKEDLGDLSPDYRYSM